MPRPRRPHVLRPWRRAGVRRAADRLRLAAQPHRLRARRSGVLRRHPARCGRDPQRPADPEEIHRPAAALPAARPAVQSRRRPVRVVDPAHAEPAAGGAGERAIVCRCGSTHRLFVRYSGETRVAGAGASLRHAFPLPSGRGAAPRCDMLSPPLRERGWGEGIWDRLRRCFETATRRWPRG
ncbi:MAG: hypothetical protein MZU91_08475 [Desulfosudis oleivorans]|nr:hypothetical protein [Desulfosudis oleivorans]